MIKFKDQYALNSARELMEMDDEFLYILTLFHIDTMKRLREIREDALAVYLFESDKQAFNRRKQQVLKFFDVNTFCRDLKKLVKQPDKETK